MRALTVRQPHAGLIVAGVKDVENRTWEPPSTLPHFYRCTNCGDRYCPQGDGEPRPTEHHPGEHVLPSGLTYGARTCGLWQPDGPGPFRLAVHAAKTEEDGDYYGMAWQAWRELDLRRPPRYGVILGTVEVTGCHHADECYPEGHRATDECTCGFGEFSTHEPHCGYEPYCSPWAEPDVYHWTLADPQPADDPVPARGQQGLWRVDDTVADTTAVP